jgi:V/A-type H+/Na+-transporting ATPase subunit D
VTPIRLPATRDGLVRGRQQLALVGKGVGLVRRKREALVAELFRRARGASDARSAVAEQAAQAWPPLLRALAAHGESGLRAMAWSEGEIHVELRPVRVWAIAASELSTPVSVRRTVDARGVTPAGAGPEVVVTAEAFEHLAELLLNVAAREQILRRLGDAVAQSSRLLRTLETRVEPRLRAAVNGVRQTLDEREREEQHRLKRFQRVLVDGRRPH